METQARKGVAPKNTNPNLPIFKNQAGRSVTKAGKTTVTKQRHALFPVAVLGIGELLGLLAGLAAADGIVLFQLEQQHVVIVGVHAYRAG